MLVCPFGAIYLSRDGRAAVKCDLCIERTKAGMDPACVTPARPMPCALWSSIMVAREAAQGGPGHGRRIGRNREFGEIRMNPTGVEETTRIDVSHVDRIVDGYDGDKSWLVMILQDVQTAYNYLPRPALERVAERLELHLSHVYRVATFYASFSLEERGKHLILACDGTACHLRGSINILEELRRQLQVEPGQTTPDKLFTLET